ncbi:Tetratricopeptide repeat protein 8 [Blomia tropicalis]|nr:Tetratricopeptide repeat protein 8 [Blomia tropicalis]
MDPLHYALSLYRRRHHDKCIEVCNDCLEKDPQNQLYWCLKLRCLTEQTYVDDLETDEDGIAETLMDENQIAQTARPGTTLRTAATSLARQSTSQAIRPVTQSGRPLSGMIRSDTAHMHGTIENALSAPRTGHSARPMTSSSGRYARIGTASLLALQESGGSFLNVERLNVDRYARMHNISKSLFEYIFHNQGNVRVALNLATKANIETKQKDWWWKAQIGKCFYKLALLRDAENNFREALKHMDVSVDIFVWLGKVYIRLDQPLAALDIYKRGLERHPNETLLLRYAARIHETMGEVDESISLFRSILSYDAIDTEAIASIAMNEFYGDQPEIALRYYRRLLQMGIFKAEMYNNIGLCCFYAQQYDMVVTCFERALMFAETDEMIADIWYNIGHVALGSGDRQFALYCFRLAITSNNDHSEAYNNLGVLEVTKAGYDRAQSANTINVQQAKSYFQSAVNAGTYLYEPHFNLALLAENSGNFDLSLEYVMKSLKLYPEHYASKELLSRVRKLYESV